MADLTPRSVVSVRRFEAADEPEIIRLWQRCGLVRPWNDPRKDIARKCRVQPELFLVGTAERRIVSSVMAGYDGHRGWVNYLAVDPSWRRQSLATALMTEVEARLRDLGCAKINLQLRHSNREALAFYRHLGFVEDALVSLGKRLESDD
jgi:ribosomal protein S18 acetylase RimI-like enzyme